jgi:hypothetical protein
MTAKELFALPAAKPQFVEQMVGKPAIKMAWEDGGADFQSRFDKCTAMRFLFSGRHMRINNIGGYTPIPLKFKLAVFLFCFNPSHSNKGFALCRSIERQ